VHVELAKDPGGVRAYRFNAEVQPIRDLLRRASLDEMTTHLSLPRRQLIETLAEPDRRNAFAISASKPDCHAKPFS